MLPYISMFLATIAISLAGGSASQSQTTVPAVSTFHAVSYFEVLPAGPSRTAALAAMKAYNAGIRTQDGFVAFESFEQEGRAGHFLMFETWRTQDAFDKRSQAVQKAFTDALQPVRVSDIDRRPYMVLTVGPRGKTTDDTMYVITHVDASPTPQLPMMLQRLAEDSRRDAGNLRFDIYQHTMRANHFTIIEAWRDRKALDAHIAAAHTKQYREDFAPMAGSPVDERLFEAIKP